jgi:hypothetical protein
LVTFLAHSRLFTSHKLYGAGFYDATGSFPCSTPKSYIFYNTPDIITPLCEYRSNWNMYVCPPLPAGASYRQIGFRPQKIYTIYNEVNALNVEWECNKTFQVPMSGDSWRFVTVRTDKRYILTWADGYTPGGVKIQPMIDMPNSVSIEPTEVIFVYPGKWDLTYFDNLKEYQWKANTLDITVKCACNVTYAKLRVFGAYGNELRATKNNTITCSQTCGNPWPAPAPNGYTCATQNPTSNNKNLTTCTMTPLQTAKR